MISFALRRPERDLLFVWNSEEEARAISDELKGPPNSKVFQCVKECLEWKWSCALCKFWTQNQAKAVQHMKTKHPEFTGLFFLHNFAPKKSNFICYRKSNC